MHKPRFVFFFIFFSLKGYHKILSIGPCTIEQVLIGQLSYIYSYIQQCVHVNLKLIGTSTLFPLWIPQVCFLACESLSVWQICSLVSFFKILHISDCIWYLTFSFWFTFLTMKISRSIRVATSDIVILCSHRNVMKFFWTNAISYLVIFFPC